MLIRGYTNTQTGKQDHVQLDGTGYCHWLSPEPSLQYFRATERFYWGYGGNYGAAYQLSFALILHFCGTIDAWNYHDDFAREVISRLPKWFFCFESKDVRNYVKWKKQQNTLLGRLYWKVAARWLFSEDFYDFYFKDLLFPIPETRSFISTPHRLLPTN